MDYYPTSGSKGKIHIDTMEGKTLLCGRKRGRFWEVQYEGVPYATIEGRSFESFLKTKDFQEGLKIIEQHAPKIYFCPKCYKKYIDTLA